MRCKAGHLFEDPKLYLYHVDFLQWRVREWTNQQTFLSLRLLHLLKVLGTFVRTPRRGHQDQLLNAWEFELPAEDPDQTACAANGRA